MYSCFALFFAPVRGNYSPSAENQINGAAPDRTAAAAGISIKEDKI
jgi:hypothetical protein